MRLVKLCCVLAGTIVASSSLMFGLDWQAVICNFNGGQGAFQGQTAAPSGSNVISVDLATSSQLAIPVSPYTTPMFVAITPDGTRAVITNGWGTYGGESSVDIVDVTTGSLLYNVPLTNVDPQGVAIRNTVSGVKAYICDSANSQLVVLDPVTYAVSSIPTPGVLPSYIALSPTKPEAYVTEGENNMGSTNVYVIDLNLETTTLMATVSGYVANGIAVTPDGSKAYVASSQTPPPHGYITPIDLNTRTAGTPIDLPGLFPLGLAITPDGQQVYAGDVSQAMLIVVETGSGGFHKVPLGVAGTDRLASVAITPDGKDVYLTNADPFSLPPSSPILYHYSRVTGLTSSETITQPYATVFSLAITPDQAPTGSVYVHDFWADCAV